jgi:hypothetical protein
MTQINIRIEPEEDEILTYLAEQRKVSKTVVARDFLLNALGQNILSILLDDYKNGKIGINKLIRLSRLPPQKVFQHIIEANIEPPITETVDEYTSSVADKIIKELRGKKKNSL